MFFYTGQSPILDSRCYLEGGGSAESFLASEDLPVGSIIGKLRINGNPNTETGDITLSLRERGAPVEIPVDTKDLVLVTALDKEGVDGPSSVYVNVICDRRHSSDPVSLFFSSNYETLIYVCTSFHFLSTFGFCRFVLSILILLSKQHTI